VSGRELAIAIYGTVTILTLLATMAVRHLTIVRTLRRHGRATFGLFTWNIYREARRYRELCEANEQPLRWWRVWWALHWSSAALIVGWWVLLAILN